MIYSTVIDGTTYYSKKHLEAEMRRSWWDGMTAGLCIGTAFMGFILVILAR